MTNLNLLQSVVLGIIEGLTEFLPISSTGHLIIAQKLMGLNEINEFFTVVVQSGSILAAVFYFRTRIVNIITKHRNIVGYLGLGLLPALILGFLFRKSLNSLENSIPAIITTAIVGGVAFYVIELLYKKQADKTLENATWQDYLVVGFFQAIALIPGTSRSGVTITGGLFRKINIKDSIEISFLMGIPLLLIATAYKLLSVTQGVGGELLFNTLIGTCFSFAVGILGIKITLGWVTKYGFKPFMIYRIILGMLLLGAYIIGWLR
jgi:undecaprenyl-diphosphatase